MDPETATDPDELAGPADRVVWLSNTAPVAEFAVNRAFEPVFWGVAQGA